MSKEKEQNQKHKHNSKPFKKNKKQHNNQTDKIRIKDLRNTLKLSNEVFVVYNDMFNTLSLSERVNYILSSYMHNSLLITDKGKHYKQTPTLTQDFFNPTLPYLTTQEQDLLTTALSSCRKGIVKVKLDDLTAISDALEPNRAYSIFDLLHAHIGRLYTHKFHFADKTVSNNISDKVIKALLDKGVSEETIYLNHKDNRPNASHLALLCNENNVDYVAISGEEIEKFSEIANEKILEFPFKDPDWSDNSLDFIEASGITLNTLDKKEVAESILETKNSYGYFNYFAKVLLTLLQHGSGKVIFSYIEDENAEDFIFENIEDVIAKQEQLTQNKEKIENTPPSNKAKENKKNKDNGLEDYTADNFKEILKEAGIVYLSNNKLN